MTENFWSGFAWQVIGPAKRTGSRLQKQNKAVITLFTLLANYLSGHGLQHWISLSSFAVSKSM